MFSFVLLDVTEKQTLQSVDPGMFEPFIQLIYKDSHKIRLLMAAALPRLFSHIKISHANGMYAKCESTSLHLLNSPVALSVYAFFVI